MIHDSRKLTISGIAGVIVASLIIASVVMAPWTPATPTSSSPKPPPGWLGGTLSVRSFISNLTEPLGVGSEGTLTVIVTSTLNASNVVVQFDMSPVSNNWPLGINFVGQNLTTWSGNLKANVSTIFNARIRAVEPGYARLLVTTTWYPPEGDGCIVRDMLFILVQENNMQVSHDPFMITTPPDLTVIPGNGTLPQTNATSSIP